MSSSQTYNVRIESIQEVTSPETIQKTLPASSKAINTVLTHRDEIKKILSGEDDRLLVISGPCSIHDPKAALEYAQHIKKWAKKFKKELLIVMRVYFEKPRTTVGWKGLINDPNLDNSFDINHGLHTARQLLIDLNQIGVAAATEYLDIISPQYISDLISWGAIGARTTESQVHRELASGISCPVGFKNGTDGNIAIAIDAIQAAAQPHHFLSLINGQSAIYRTSGNPDCHVILRGGKEPNHDRESIESTCRRLKTAGLRQMVLIDLSHANSRKIAENQPIVAAEVCNQISKGENRIIGVMIESHLVAGKQAIHSDRPLVYGQSITDACIGIENTNEILELLSDAVKEKRKLD